MKEAAAILAAARATGDLIATAESCTGGMVSAAITDIAGSSAIFDRGFVTYTNTAKMQMLGVKAQTLADHGAVSEQVAAQMAAGAITQSDATLAVSITGIAGPADRITSPKGASALDWHIAIKSRRKPWNLVRWAVRRSGLPPPITPWGFCDRRLQNSRTHGISPIKAAVCKTRRFYAVIPRLPLFRTSPSPYS